MLRPIALALLVLLLPACTDDLPEAPPVRPNVLFIAVDDLRPEFGAYGREGLHAPNLDRLAGEGVVFDRAYVNVPVCGASRASLMTGIRPARTRFRNYDVRVDKDAPGAVTLPQLFRENGYTTIGIGKVLHHNDDAERSWSRPHWHPGSDPATQNVSWRDYVLPENVALDKGNQRGAPYEAASVPDSAYYDGKIARRAVQELQRLKGEGRPFFLAVGFLKPHLPFNAPQRYWDLYDPAELRLADNPFLPENAPKEAWHSFGELRNYASVPGAPAPVPDTLALKLVHGYRAALSYMDANLGLVLDELDRLGLAENTIVVLWGDHGWQLGEHGLWCKHSPFNNAVHAPLIVRAPGYAAGRHSAGLVEFVDIYPTLAELAGLTPPGMLAGTSFARRLTDPDAAGKEAVFPRWIDAESIRTDHYLYTEWYGKDGKPAARMLYDHEKDPAENVNVAEDPAYREVVDDLARRLHEHVDAVESGPVLP